MSSHNLPSIFDDGDAYDLVLKDIPYGLDFYVALARAAKGPVLDIACGTGRILLPCLAAGVDIEGLDLFEPMLKTLRTKAAAINLSPRLQHRFEQVRVFNVDTALDKATKFVPCRKRSEHRTIGRTRQGNAEIETIRDVSEHEIVRVAIISRRQIL